MLPLQAADYIVWQIRRKIDQDQDPNMAIRRLALASATDGSVIMPGDIPILVDVWDEARLGSLGQEIITENIKILDDPGFSPDTRDMVREVLVTRLRGFF